MPLFIIHSNCISAHPWPTRYDIPVIINAFIRIPRFHGCCIADVFCHPGQAFRGLGSRSGRYVAKGLGVHCEGKPRCGGKQGKLGILHFQVENIPRESWNIRRYQPAKVPEKYGIPERDAFYKSVSFAGWGGASGHDAPMIAYDALLRARESWAELCSGGMFHGGDSDSTGVMAAAWWGGIYGMAGVPPCNYNKLEYRERLEDLAKALLKAAESRK